LKSGCRIEQRQLGHADRLEACLAIDLVVAWRIYALNTLGREVPQAPGTVYVEEAEWNALMVCTTKNPVAPAQPPTLRDAFRRVASLGGFLGRNSDGEPGTQTLWIGLQRLDDIVAMWRGMIEATHPPCPAESILGKDQVYVRGKRKSAAMSRERTYRIPRFLASAAIRSTSARRSESFLAIQVSQDFPVAVSSPVKAIAAIWS